LLARADAGLVSFAPFPVLEANAATKFYDYLAAGLPVVINYGGWQAEWLAKHDCGLSAPQGDEGALATQLARLISDASLRQQMGERGRAVARQHFDRRQLAGEMLAAMLKVLRN
jgi:glycosyltransferase involved in cell wall biosynthesis